MSVTAQALDVVYGRSAAGIPATLERPVDGRWQTVASAVTDENGNIRDWADQRLDQGAYRIVFDSDSYFATFGVYAAYPEIAVAFVVPDDGDACQIQVLLAPCSYSMFFGAHG